LGIKLALSQIKLFILKLLLNYDVSLPKDEVSNKDAKRPFNLIETKDILFNSQIERVNASMSKVQ